MAACMFWRLFLFLRTWTVAPAGMLIPICLGLRSPLELGSLRR